MLSKAYSIMVDLQNDWDEILAEEFEKDYYIKLRGYLKSEYSSHIVYPHMNDIFNAFKLTPYSAVKAVILGQDPYHGPNQAHGLAFSVKAGVPPPPSLLNMFKELENDIGMKTPSCGCLNTWAEQGVLLLNATLTVRGGEPMSHKNRGWEIFTDRVIELLNERENPVIFILWGSHAQAKQKIITNRRHYILRAPHPSPLSAYRGFFGCSHFSKVNKILESMNVSPIDWSL